MRHHLLTASLALFCAAPTFANQATVGGPDQLSAPNAVTGPAVGFDRDPASVGDTDNDGMNARQRAAVDSHIDSARPFDRPEVDGQLPGQNLPGGPPPGVNGMVGGDTGSFGPRPIAPDERSRGDGFGNRSGSADDRRLGVGSSDPRDATLGR